MYCITFTMPDGTVRIVHPAPQYDDPQYLDSVAIQAIANAGLGPTPYTIRLASELPDRRWRNAYRDDGKGIAVDLAEAKKIRAAELEREQVALLKATAKDHMIAFAKGDEVAAATSRQKVQALDALDKAAIEASVTNVADLDALEKHEPQPIKDAKPAKSVVTDGIAVEPR